MDDNERTIQDISLYCSPHSILVLNKVGMIYRLCCPFQVKPRHQVHILEEGRVYYVSVMPFTTCIKERRINAMPHLSTQM